MHDTKALMDAAVTGRPVPKPKRGRKLKTASYRNGVGWIAEMDEGAETDPAIMAEVPTVLLLAELFGTTPERVAADVIRLRKKGTR